MNTISYPTNDGKVNTAGILFDLDGVLVDSTDLHVRAYERVFQRAGLEFSEEARRAVGQGKARSLVIELALPQAPTELRQRLAEAKPNTLETLLSEHGDCALPGARETIHALRDAGVPIGIVTNSRAPHIWLRSVGIASLVQVVVTGSDVSSPKPSPEGYLQGAARLALEPERCLAVEDSEDGCRAARDAGMRVLVIADQRPPWLDARDDYVDRLRPAEVLRMLGATPTAGSRS